VAGSADEDTAPRPAPPSAVGAPPRVTRARAVLVTALLALGAAALVALAILRPLWLLALPALALAATALGGLVLFVRARRRARRGRPEPDREGRA